MGIQRKNDRDNQKTMEDTAFETGLVEQAKHRQKQVMEICHMEENTWETRK